MARLTNEQWQSVRADYEISGLSYSELAKKHNTSKPAISRRAKKEDWTQGKVEHLVQKKVNAIREIKEVEQQAERLVPLDRLAIDNEVDKRLAQQQYFIDSAMSNQEKANGLINDLPVVELDDLNKHSQITARNKDTVLGKQPDTAVQVNNNIQPPVFNITGK